MLRAGDQLPVVASNYKLDSIKYCAISVTNTYRYFGYNIFVCSCDVKVERFLHFFVRNKMNIW